MPTKSNSGKASTAALKTASRAVDKQLLKYREMRDFEKTKEPSGKLAASAAASSAALPFVIQKHAATRLHYDFRLGWRGVLKSWAVTKGPSYFTGDRRLAVQVEDHPIEYGGFEGTIPKGQYGGGTVMLWDHGTWEPHGDADEGLRTGRLKFALHGEKMKGNWTLVRMGGRAANESKPNWLLIKEHDEYAQDKPTPAITEDAPNSVVTHRDLDAIAKAEDHIWNSHPKGANSAKASNNAEDSSHTGTKKTAPLKGKPAVKSTPAPAGAIHKQALKPGLSKALKQAETEPMPRFIPPQLASQSTQPPEGPDWIHELKLDGYRIQLHIEKKLRASRQVKLYTRTGLDWTARMPAIAAAAATLDVKSALLDGEVVVLTPSGSTSFADLQAAFQDHKPSTLTYFAFDLLHLDGKNLRALPLIERKAVLAQILSGQDISSILRFSEHLHEPGAIIFKRACELGAEGIVSKQTKSKYSSGRDTSWVKVKCIRQQEFVVAGFTPPGKGGPGIGALLIGYYEKEKLIYAGRTGTGFSHQTQLTLRRRLDTMRRATPAFDVVPAAGRKDAIWVRPELVAQVNFATWTSDGLLRQAAFQGLREDKPAKEVTKEEPPDQTAPAKRPKATHSAAKTIKLKTMANPALSKPAPANPASSEAPDLGNLRLTHPDKIIDPETSLTKRQLAAYYLAVAKNMLPFIANRPLSVVRCPNGAGKPCFFQKHSGTGLPEGIESVTVPDKKTGEPEQYITLSTAQALASLAQLGVLEIHPWGSRNDDLETPDRLIFDLDPDVSIQWETIAASASELRKQLKKLGLESFVKTTGGKGLHVVAPIVPDHDWTTIKTFAHNFALQIERSNPGLYLTRMTKAARKGKIYLDYLRNERGATAVAPFSPRARLGVRVALPLSWSELDQPPAFSVANFDQWKKRLSRDPWAKMETLRQSLSKVAITSVSV